MSGCPHDNEHCDGPDGDSLPCLECFLDDPDPKDDET